jgi:hypothetical protein
VDFLADRAYLAQRSQAIRLRPLDKDRVVDFALLAVLVDLAVTPTDGGGVVLCECGNAGTTLPELI